MKSTEAMKWAGALAALLERLIDLQEDLHAVVREKLDAMRRAGSEGMLAASHREGELAAEVAALDGRRRECVSKLCDAIGMPPDDNGTAVGLRALAAQLDPAGRDRLVELGDRLRGRMLKVAEANRVVELVSREMLAHFKTVFAAMTQSDDEAPTYSSHGQAGGTGGSRVLDAVG